MSSIVLKEERMGYILIGRHKTKLDTWHEMNGVYEYPNKSDFGSLAKIKRGCLDYDLKIIDKFRFIREFETQ